MFRLIKSVCQSAWRGASRGVAHDAEWRHFLARHPRLVKFIRRRLTSDEEFGLYLTIGTVVAAFFVYLFFGVTVDFIGPQPILQSDLNIINLLQVLRGPAFNRVMLLVTDLGEWPVVFAGVAAVGAVLALDRRRYALMALIVSVAGAEVFAWLVGWIIQRPRPELVNVLVHTHGSSFPSSHTLVSVAFYGLLTYFLFRKIRHRLLRWLTVVAGAALVMTIGFSRVYLGAHWPSDVFASYAAGAAWLTALITTLEIRRRYRHRDPAPILSRRRLMAYAAVAGALWSGFFLAYFVSHPLQAVTDEEQAASFYLAPEEISTRLFTELPRQSESITGATKEPINVIMVGTREQVNKAFTDAGWMLTDRINPKSFCRMLAAGLTNGPYPTGPGIPAFWNGRPNDFAYEQSTLRQTIRERHHVHFWSTPFVTTGERRVWVGTAHYDKGLKLKSSLFVPAHSIDPAVDKEREKTTNDLAATGNVEKTNLMGVVDPTLGKNETGDLFFTDGQAALVFLR
ncbi:MAG: LssY C-terminal domain-containing protein [Patescibacteria group bacterium]|nr:LssY C-terminal domain-containing protein [Patescibacteria group bacterium]